MTIVLPVLPQLPSSNATVSTCSSTESVPDVKEHEAQQSVVLNDGELLDSVPHETSSDSCAPIDGGTSAADDLSHDSMSSQVQSDWSVRDTWTCPPFSYEQSEDHVTIVLHVPRVKKPTMTSLLEKNSVKEISV